MRNLIITLTLLCFNYAVNAQEYYWTTYSFNVEAEDVTTVVSLTDDYFSQPGSKTEGVTVYLFENHFRDSDNDWSHQFAFTGSLDAMGEQYSRGENDSWELFLTKLSQFTKSHSAAAGNSLITIGEAGTHPIQNILWLDVEDAGKFAAAWKKYHSKFNPDDRRITLGQFRLGRSAMHETHYVLQGFNDFKSAFNAGKYRSGNKAAEKAWDEFIDAISEDVTILRTNTRIMVGKW
jgi:hypothetical protein